MQPNTKVILEILEEIIPGGLDKLVVLERLRRAQEEFDRINQYANPYEEGMGEREAAKFKLEEAKKTARAVGITV